MKNISFLEGSVFVYDVNEFLNKIKNHKNIIQVFDADKIAGKQHLKFAIKKALASFENGNNISNNISIEIMLYAAATKHINKAMKLGIHKGKNNVVFLVSENPIDLSIFPEFKQEPVIEYKDSKKEKLMDIFEITKEEIDAAGENKIPELVIERIALIDVYS